MLDRCVDNLSVEKREDLTFLLNTADAKLTRYTSHLVRCAWEASAKKEQTKEAKRKTIYFIMDYKMKLLLLLFRESQAEFFGKSGFSLHGIMALFLRADGDFDMEV